MSYALFDGRPFRLLTVVDCHTRESVAIVPRVNFRAIQVVDVVDHLAKNAASPKPFAATMVVGSPGECSINGLI